MAMTDLRLVIRSLTSRSASTALCVATVGVGVGLLVTLLTVRGSAQDAFRRGSGNAHMLVSRDSSPMQSVLNALYHAAAPQRSLPLAKAAELAADRRVAWAVPIVQGDSFRGFRLTGTEPRFFELFEPIGGVPFRFAQGSNMAEPFDAVLGAAVARATGLRAGDRFYTSHGFQDTGGRAVSGDRPEGEGAADHGHGDDDHDHDHADEPAAEHLHDQFPIRVAGVLAPTGTAHDHAVFLDMRATWLIHAAESRPRQGGAAAQAPTLDTLTEEERPITGVLVRCRLRPGARESGATVSELFGQLRADPSYTVAIPGSEVAALFRIVGDIDRIVVAIAALVLVSAAVTVLLVLYLSMLQRRRQVAVLRVLGASRGRVFGMVLAESALIGVLASLVGVLMAVGGMRLVAELLRQRTRLDIATALDAPSTVLVVCGTVVLACLAGVTPALMAYRVVVVRNLRPIG